MRYDFLQSDEGTDNQLYPLEFLNSLDPSGLPTRKLFFKKNAIVMLIWNLNAKQGLITGVRIVITYLHDYTVTTQLIDSGKTDVPRFNLIPSDPTIPHSPHWKLTLQWLSISLRDKRVKELDCIGWLFKSNSIYQCVCIN